LPRAVDQQADAKGIELKGIELKGIELKGIELKGIELKGIELKGIELKRSELTLILEGIELASVKRRRRWSLPQSAGDISHNKSSLP
jgi:hypothetical protein